MRKDNHERCSVCQIYPFERNNYYYGKLMTARDFFTEQTYFNEKRWLINRMILGWGVVCGLDVKPADKSGRKWTVTHGLAIDCCGREILVCEDTIVDVDDLEPECTQSEKTTLSRKKPLVICLEYRECKGEPVQLSPITCDQKEKSEYNRIQDSFRLCLRYEEDVHLSEPYGKYCPLMESKERESNEYQSFHQYFCHKLKEGCPECEERECLVLARLVPADQEKDHEAPTEKSQQAQSTSQEEDPETLYVLDPCYKRKLVFNNPLLYDLIHCFHNDLPHIKDFSWRKFHGQAIGWDTFRAEIVEKGLTVTFDRKMKLETINRNNFLFAAIIKEFGTGYLVRKYIPAADFECDPDGYWVKFKVSDRWRSEEIEERADSEIRRQIMSRRRENGPSFVDFEITLRGSSILAENDRALDSEFDGARLPTGNGVQGGYFVSWFSVVYEPEETSEAQADEEPETINDF